MASSKDFEKIWESYQEVVKTKDVSIVDYCQRNGIVYSQFQQWYKKHVSGVNIIPVSDSQPQENSTSAIQPARQKPRLSGSVGAKVLYVNIEFSNGLKVYQKSIDYNRLKHLVEKLEDLC
jgi:hypothetical protein